MSMTHVGNYKIIHIVEFDSGIKEHPTQIAMGFNENAVQPYATWCGTDYEFYWGHYYIDAVKCYNDFRERILKELNYIDSRKGTS